MCINCNVCVNLSVDEDHQRHNEPHICKEYSRRVFHRSQEFGYHPMIYPCAECERDNYGAYSSLRPSDSTVLPVRCDIL